MNTKKPPFVITTTRVPVSVAMRVTALIVALLLPLAATAEPIKLKFSFFTSDRSYIYQNSIKPFVDAVNKDGKGLVEVERYFSGTISNVQADQPQLVTDGTADLALIVPGRTPQKFSDTTVMELPGLFRDQREASLVFTRLTEARALKGYENFVVLGAFVADSESIHTRKPVASIDDLKGLTIRVNNQTQAKVLEKLGAIPAILAINQTTEAISTDRIDGATFPPSMLFEFGVGRVTSNHYMTQLGGAPTALVINRKKFEQLPPAVQTIIRKYSGPWLAEHSATSFEALDKLTLEQLKAEFKTKSHFPVTRRNSERMQQISVSVAEDWAAISPHNKELLTRVRAEIKNLRSSD